MQRGVLTITAALLALLGISATGFYLYSQPRTLRLAVGPLGSEDARMAAAFVQGLSRDKADVRIRLVLTEGAEDSARKIDAGQAELALLRADIAMPSTADTVLITRRSYPFFITSKDTAITRIADLRGRKVGVARNPSGNIALLKRVLAQYEVRPEEIEIVGLTQDEMKQLQAKLQARGYDMGKIDGVYGVATRDAVRAEQMRLGLPADSWPTKELLDKL